MLTTLWNRQAEMNRLAAPYARHLKPTASEKIAPLDALFASLTTDLDRNVTRHADLQNFNNTQVRIIFLDYYMGRSGDQQAVDRAKAIVAGIKEKYTNLPLPLLVLMSASQSITQDMIRQFRESTGWLGGMFYFVKKADFLNKEMLLLQIATWSISTTAQGLILRKRAKLGNLVGGDDATRRPSAWTLQRFGA